MGLERGGCPGLPGRPGVLAPAHGVDAHRALPAAVQMAGGGRRDRRSPTERMHALSFPSSRFRWFTSSRPAASPAARARTSSAAETSPSSACSSTPARAWPRWPASRSTTSSWASRSCSARDAGPDPVPAGQDRDRARPPSPASSTPCPYRGAGLVAGREEQGPHDRQRHRPDDPPPRSRDRYRATASASVPPHLRPRMGSAIAARGRSHAPRRWRDRAMLNRYAASTATPAPATPTAAAPPRSSMTAGIPDARRR